MSPVAIYCVVGWTVTIGIVALAHPVPVGIVLVVILGGLAIRAQWVRRDLRRARIPIMPWEDR